MVPVSLEMVRVSWSAHLVRRRFASMSRRRSVQRRPVRSAMTTKTLTVILSKRRSASRLTRRHVSTPSLQRRAPLVQGAGTGNNVGRSRHSGAASRSQSKCVQTSNRLNAIQRPSQSVKLLCLSGPLRNVLNSTNPTVRSPRSKCAFWVSHRVTAQRRRSRNASM